jgi:hypothetical protein
MLATIGPERHHGTLPFEEHEAAAETQGAVVGHAIHLSRLYRDDGVRCAGAVNQHRIGALPLLPLMCLLDVILGRMGAGIAGDRRHALSRGQKVELIHRLERLHRDKGRKLRGGHSSYEIVVVRLQRNLQF